jgi:hypothetical protein
MRKSSRLVHISTNVPEDIYTLLNAEADATGFTKTEIICKILTVHFYGNRPQTEPDAMAEIKQLMFRYLRHKLTNVFEEWTENLPHDLTDLRYQLNELGKEQVHRRVEDMRNRRQQRFEEP